MLVKELINKQAYWSPITISGGSTRKNFFYKEYGKSEEERQRACNEYGDCLVQHYDFATDYKSQPWKSLLRFRGFAKLFCRINPKRLYINLE